MNVDTISIWTTETKTNTCSFLYRKEHEDDFKKHIKANSFIPKHIFAISPNAYHIEDLCLDYAAELKKQKRITKSEIADKISAINNSLKAGEFSLTERLLELLSQEWRTTESTLSNFFDIKRNIVSSLLKPMLWEPPFLLTQNPALHKQWWKLTPNRKELIEELQKEINLKLTGTGSDFIAYTNWLKNLAIKLSKMRAQTKTERHLALNEASAYLMVLADNHLKANRHSLSTLLLHRSADLLLMRICDEYNLINFTGEKPEFHSIPKNCKSKEIHFRSSRLALKQNGLSHDPAREKLFDKLNNLRNHLMYTHYFSAPEKSSAHDIHNKIKLHLASIGGKEWSNALNSYQPLPELSIKILFESNPILTSAITEVSINELLD